MMQHVKITNAGRDSRLIEGFTYVLERLDSGLLRLTSVGGKFSTLVDPDTSPVEFEYVDAPEPSPLKGWRNDHAVKLWCDSFLGYIERGSPQDPAAALADMSVARFKKRWEGDTFLHNVGDKND